MRPTIKQVRHGRSRQVDRKREKKKIEALEGKNNEGGGRINTTSRRGKAVGTLFYCKNEGDRNGMILVGRRHGKCEELKKKKGNLGRSGRTEVFFVQHKLTKKLGQKIQFKSADPISKESVPARNRGRKNGTQAKKREQKEHKSAIR